MTHLVLTIFVNYHFSLNVFTPPITAISLITALSLLSCFPGRGGGGRGGFRDDRRDRYSGGRSYGGGGGGGGSYRDKDSDRGFGGGPKSAFGAKTQNGGGYGGSTYNKGASSGGSYGNSYSSNGQASFGTTNQVGAFGGQNFQAPPQFGAAQAATQNGMGRPPFPFNPQAQQPQQPPPMVPYSMPPPFPQ